MSRSTSSKTLELFNCFHWVSQETIRFRTTSNSSKSFCRLRHAFLEWRISVIRHVSRDEYRFRSTFKCLENNDDYRSNIHRFSQYLRVNIYKSSMIWSRSQNRSKTNCNKRSKTIDRHSNRKFWNSWLKNSIHDWRFVDLKTMCSTAIHHCREKKKLIKVLEIFVSKHVIEKSRSIRTRHFLTMIWTFILLKWEIQISLDLSSAKTH